MKTEETTRPVTSEGVNLNNFVLLLRSFSRWQREDCLSFRISVIPSVCRDNCIQYSLLTPTELSGAVCKMFWPTIKKAPIGIESTTSIFDGRDPCFYLVIFRSLLLGQLYPSLYDLLQWSVAVELFFLFCLRYLWHSWHRFCEARQVIPTQFNLQSASEYVLKL